MRLPFLIFLFTAFFSRTSLAQSLRLLHATDQTWAGGACCRTGVDYSLTFQSIGKKIIPDSLFIGNQAFPLVTKEHPGIYPNLHIQRSGDSTWYSIQVGTSTDRPEQIFPIDTLAMGHGNSWPGVAPFHRAACLVYREGCKRMLLEIAAFEHLPRIAYP